MEMIASGSITDAETIARLRSELAARQVELTAAREQLEAAHGRHLADIAAIGRTLMEEAESRDWCGQYDAVITELNGVLNVELPVRVRDYTVTNYLRLDVHVSATDEDDAQQQAADIVTRIERDANGVDGVYAYPSDDYYEVTATLKAA